MQPKCVNLLCTLTQNKKKNKTKKPDKPYIYTCGIQNSLDTCVSWEYDECGDCVRLEAININAYGGLIADGNSGDVVDGVSAAADDVLIVLMYIYDTSFSVDSTDGTDAGTGDIDNTSSYSIVKIYMFRAF